MAPELFGETRNRSPVWSTKQSDIYAFGCVILQARRFPYYYLGDMAIIHHKYTATQPSRQLYPPCLDRHWHLMERCWSTLPQERPLVDMAVSAIA
ncbi:hypothetical protein EDB19DRAFT_1647685 [Suillus lakei]|nr:hypothetical protein EDB19DRAFT_1647685 [Suillus lakei]